MPAYLYRGGGAAPAAPAAPDAEALLDALADEVLDEPDVGAALSSLQRRGFPLSDGAHHPGTHELAQAVRHEQQALQRQYSFDALTGAFASKVREAVREELRTIEQHYAARADGRAAEIEAAEQALHALAQHAAGTPPDGSRPLKAHEAEARYEELFIQVQEGLEDTRRDRQEERARLETLESVPRQPIDAVQLLQDYEFLSDDAGRMVQELNAIRPKMAELMATEWRHTFRGAEQVNVEAAADVARDMRELDRMEGHLRSGKVAHMDPERVGVRLGHPAMGAVEGLQRMESLLHEAGYLVDDVGGARLSPRGIRRLGERALREMFTSLKRAGSGEHEAEFPGPGSARGAVVRPFEGGDPFQIHLTETLLRAASRAPGVPIRLGPMDFMVHEPEAGVHSATVLMIDLSYTMTRHGRILAAKKVALALDTLLRTRFPKDTLELVGFSSVARSLTLAELPNVKPTLGQPFTNMQDGLRLASRLLCRHRGANRQVILITDGEPTAVTDEGGRIRSCYPPDERIFNTTLEAVRQCTAHGIVINIIMLDRQPELMEFVRRMAHVNRGRALMCTPKSLGQYVIFDYLRGKQLAIAGG